MATSLKPTAGPDGIAPGTYTRVAKWLHWVIAALILVQLVGGFVMHKLPNSAGFKYEAYQFHKSFGLVVLALSLFRLAWRLVHKAPPLPDGTKPWERFLARATQVGFYVLMIAVPLAGWMIISTSASGIPSEFMLLFPIPELPVLFGSHGFWEGAHEIMAKLIIGLLVLHVAGALKHRYVNHDGVVSRMTFGRPEKGSTAHAPS